MTSSAVAISEDVDGRDIQREDALRTFFGPAMTGGELAPACGSRGLTHRSQRFAVGRAEIGMDFSAVRFQILTHGTIQPDQAVSAVRLADGACPPIRG